MSEQHIRQAIDKAVNYLVNCQSDAGSWEEYNLPVGRSTHWATAYVGLPLARLGRQGLSPQALVAAQRAAAWLVNTQSYPAGWGYNDRTGPDADSTAYALLLLQTLDLPCHAKDVDWLLECWRPNGGCATYAGPAAWGVAHPDVTPVAFWALPDRYQRQLQPDVIRYLETSRHVDGTWPAYWWRTCHYCTYLNLSLMHDFGLGGPSALVITTQESHAIHSAFDLAFLVGVATVQQGPTDLTIALTHELLALQQDDGGWPGGYNLRVTDPECYCPWDSPAGCLYKDSYGLISTAGALTVLRKVLP